MYGRRQIKLMPWGKRIGKREEILKVKITLTRQQIFLEKTESFAQDSQKIIGHIAVVGKQCRLSHFSQSYILPYFLDQITRKLIFYAKVGIS